MTNFRIKIYAQNLKGSSKNVWLDAQTLRSPERLIDNLQNSLQKDSFLINTTSIIRGKPVLITMLIGVAFALVAIIFLILIKLLRGRRSNQPQL